MLCQLLLLPSLSMVQYSLRYNTFTSCCGYMFSPETSNVNSKSIENRTGQKQRDCQNTPSTTEFLVSPRTGTKRRKRNERSNGNNKWTPGEERLPVLN